VKGLQVIVEAELDEGLGEVEPDSSGVTSPESGDALLLGDPLIIERVLER
jgi:hypothetical protein